VAENLTDNVQGVINYYAVPAPTSGSGLLATITFLAQAPGFSELTFTLANLAFAGEPVIMPLPQPAQITVNPGAGQPTSTFTPIPGQPITPTPTFTIIPTTDTPTPIIAAVSPTATSTPPPTSTPTATNTPVAPAVEIPPGATVGFCYRVQPGENLSSLGQKFGIDPQFISLVNDLYPPGHVYPQKILFMPSQFGTGPNVYLVQSGDTLALIAERCGLPADFLAAVNGLALEANLANIGTLIIPRPPYAPPARYPYGPPHVWPPPCPPGCY
jgi:LysM repeat protein